MKDKQIEEMANIMKMSIDGLGSGTHNFTGFEISTMFAKALYNAGYRKASDVARKIFEEIEDLLFKRYRIDMSSYDNMGLLEKLAELKKKYESEKDNDK